MPDSERAVVSNTGPFISLERLPEGFSLLRRLYDRVFIPPEVLVELSNGPRHKDYLKEHGLSDLVVVQSVEDTDPDLAELDLGERAAIALALDLKLPLLIEERAGRDIATAKGLTVSGIAGQLRKAFNLGILTRAEALDALKLLLGTSRINNAVFRAIEEALR